MEHDPAAAHSWVRKETVMRQPGFMARITHDPEIRERLRSTRLVILQGWLFRGEDAIHRCASIVREVCRPADRIQEAARSIVEEVRAGASTVVGVHIRRGDYRKHLGGQFFFPTSVY